MGLSIVYGHILLKTGQNTATLAPIQALGTDTHFPFLSTDMFSTGASEAPQYYDQQIIAFAATYKNIEYGGDFEQFIRKWENLLQQLDFDRAHLELQTEVMGTYRFFWRRRQEPDVLAHSYHSPDLQLLPMPDWYFGFGYRTRSGTLITPLTEDQVFSCDGFKYPVQPL